MFFYSETQDVVVPSLLTLTVNSSSLSFSNTCVGDNSQNSFTITATGNAIETVTISDDTDQYNFSPSTFSLSGGANQIVNVTFAPTSWGIKTGSISVVSSGGSTKSVSLSAVCIANPLIITSSVGQINFGNGYVNETSSATFIVSAGGRVQDIVLLADDSDQFDFSPTSFSMTGANQTQTVTVYFTPSSNGSKLGVLTLSASGGDVAHVSLTGSAIYRPLVLTSSVNSLSFSNTVVNLTSSKTFTVSAGGLANEIVTLSDDTNQFSFSPSSFALTGSVTTQTVTITHTPTILGASSGTLTLSSSGGSIKTVSLTGSAVSAMILSTSTDSVMFPYTYATTTTASIQVWGSSTGGTETVTITDNSSNFGSATSTVVVVGDGGNTKQTINLRFSPTTTGSLSGTLTLSSSGGNIKTVGLTGSSDQNYSNTALLLRGDGTNGSTSIVDSSINRSTVTVFGNTAISTAQSKYGSSSIYFDGNGDYLTVPSSTNYDFGTGSFTIEMWINPSNSGVTNATQKALFGKRASNAAYSSMLAFLTYSATAAKYSVSFYGTVTGTAWNIAYSTVSLVTPNTWTHLAFVRNVNEYSIYINGVKYLIGTAAGSITFDNNAFALGSNTSISPGTLSYFGYMDDIRVTKGIARYTGNFTPPGPI